MNFKLFIQEEAIADIQEAIKYYNKQQVGLGRIFFEDLDKSINQLIINPFFQIRYENVRCLPLKKFPFMVHYTIDEGNSSLTIRAVFNTSKDPGIWKTRSSLK